MFTGLVKARGVVNDIKNEGNGMNISITVSDFSHVVVGNSILTNGVCLTATDVYDSGFSVHAMHETLNRTTLKGLKKGDLVNLEPALMMSDRLDGHIVTGHIDGIGKVSKRMRQGTSVEFWIGASPEIMKFIVEKGSIAIDGISLTVTNVKNDAFGVSIIPHTLKNTNLIHLHPGDLVNLETDIIGKYVIKLIQGYGVKDNEKRNINEEYLAKHGF